MNSDLSFMHPQLIAERERAQRVVRERAQVPRSARAEATRERARRAADALRVERVLDAAALALFATLALGVVALLALTAGPFA